MRLINDFSIKNFLSCVKNPKLPPILKLRIGILKLKRAFEDLSTVPSPPRTIIKSGKESFICKFV